MTRREGNLFRFCQGVINLNVKILDMVPLTLQCSM